ncbi:MAG: DEAD/DEAH box helicase [Ilumatobacteraceae bacterium]
MSTSSIACPGRLEDLIGQRHCSLGDVMVTVLDEADHMADLGFLPAVRRLLDLTPAGGQRMLFSATLDGARRRARAPPHHERRHARARHGARRGTAHRSPRAVDRGGRQAGDHPRARRRARTERCCSPARSTAHASSLASSPTSGVPAVDLHGNLSQGARERNLESFSRGSSRVLVATDIAARGIHVDDISLVVHVDPPAEHKAYLHRSGRTARAGAAAWWSRSPRRSSPATSSG